MWRQGHGQGEFGGGGMSFSCAAAKMMMKPYGGWWWWWGCREGNKEMGDGEGELHGSVNDFLAVQRDVKDRLT